MQYPFPHHRLEAYRQALELAVLTKEIADRVPRGFRGLADQLLRSGTAVVLLVAEGADRGSAAQKRQRFVEAQGECGEAAAAVELLTRMNLLNEEDHLRFHQIAGRTGALLTGLIRRHS